ncbi:MAG: hypothetical protein IPJ34_24065 [Myxococcales bacterium]|nr:hypothetical protein [Myxococcales bacterium]
MRAWWIGVMLVTTSCALACRRKATPSNPPVASASSPSGSASAPPALPPLRLERFLDAHALPNGLLRIAAVARDASIVLATVDAKLETRSVDVLAKEFTADPATTEIVLVGDDLVVAVGKLTNVRAPWLLRKGLPPKALPADWCRTAHGVAYVVRDPSAAIVRFSDKDGEKSAEPIVVPLEAEVHLACGPSSAVLFVPDGPRLQAARVFSGKAAALVELEKDGDLEAELRDRQVLVRDDASMLLLRLSETSLAVREVKGDELGKWVSLTDDKGKPFALDPDADLLAATAAKEGPGFLLVSSPMKGACPSGDPPRRIVLHTLARDSAKVESRPIVELPCGVDAIPAKLTLEGPVARLSWTEPLSTCNPVQVGLSVGAVVVASSDKPGARRADMAAEAIVRVDDTRFLGVVRPGGCVGYEAPGNGALQWAPLPK